MTATLKALPGYLDVVAYAGDDLTFVLTLVDNATPPNPVPIVGATKAQVRPSQESDTYWEMTVTVDPVDTNKATLSISGADTREMADDATLCSMYVGTSLITAPMFQGVWDWQFTDGGIKTLVSGKFTAIAEVTR
jgi:hypothetical protein